MRYKAGESPDCGEVEGVRHEGTGTKKKKLLIDLYNTAYWVLPKESCIGSLGFCCLMLRLLLSSIT